MSQTVTLERGDSSASFFHVSVETQQYRASKRFLSPTTYILENGMFRLCANVLAEDARMDRADVQVVHSAIETIHRALSQDHVFQPYLISQAADIAAAFTAVVEAQILRDLFLDHEFPADRDIHTLLYKRMPRLGPESQWVTLAAKKLGEDPQEVWYTLWWYANTDKSKRSNIFNHVLYEGDFGKLAHKLARDLRRAQTLITCEPHRAKAIKLLRGMITRCFGRTGDMTNPNEWKRKLEMSHIQMAVSSHYSHEQELSWDTILEEADERFVHANTDLMYDNDYMPRYRRVDQDLLFQQVSTEELQWLFKEAGVSTEELQWLVRKAGASTEEQHWLVRKAEELVDLLDSFKLADSESQRSRRPKPAGVRIFVVPRATSRETLPVRLHLRGGEMSRVAC